MSSTNNLFPLDLEIRASKSGAPTLYYQGRFILSAYDPVKEAERIAGSIKGERVVVVGLGLGYLVRAVGTRLERAIEIIGEPERFKSVAAEVLSEVPSSKMAVAGDLSDLERQASAAAASGATVVLDSSLGATGNFAEKLNELIAMVTHRPRITCIHLRTAGDVLRSLGAVHLYKRMQPHLAVEFITDRLYGDLVRLSPDVDFVTEITEGVVPELTRPMLGVNFACDTESARILAKLNPVWSIGYREKNTGLELCDDRNAKLADDLAVMRNRMNRYHFYQRMLGLPFSFECPRLIVPDGVPQVPPPYSVVQFGAGSEQEVWSAKRVDALTIGGALKQIGGRWIAIGSKAEAARATSAGICDDDNLCGQTDFVRLAAILSKAELYVGHDSGPTHLAAMLGAPTVALFGFTSPILNAPIGPRTIVIQSDLQCAFTGCRMPCPDVTCTANYDEEIIRLAAAFLATENFSTRLDIAADLSSRGVRYFLPGVPVEERDPMRKHLFEESKKGLPRDLALSLTREWLETADR